MLWSVKLVWLEIDIFVIVDVDVIVVDITDFILYFTLNVICFKQVVYSSWILWWYLCLGWSNVCCSSLSSWMSDYW